MKIDKFKEHKEFNDILKLIERDCKPYIDFLNKIKDIKTFFNERPLLYRGMKNIHKDYGKRKIRKDRKALDSGIYYEQNKLDDIFNKVLGVRPRGEGLFSTSDKSRAYNYGEVYVIFPIGEFDYVSSDFFVDSVDYFQYYFDVIAGFEGVELYNEYIEKYGKPVKKGVDSLVPDKYLENFVTNYKLNDDIKISIREGNEIIFICDDYYFIKVSTSNQDSNEFKIIDWLKNI